MFEPTETHAVFQKPRLIYAGQRHDLSLGLFRVGRDPQNNLVLDDAALSRHHFAIDVQAHQAQLIDLGSANGTFVNKNRVRSAWLKDGDKIKIGEQLLQFEAPGFVLSHALFDEGEQTNSKKIAGSWSLSWVPTLALMVASSSLFMQLMNYERQKKQDNQLFQFKIQLAERLKPQTQPEVIVKTSSVAERWQKAVMDFRSGAEEEACESIKTMIPEINEGDILKDKAQSFYRRKCLL